MKKIRIILLILALLALAVFFFWDPIIDFLPIDQSGWVVRDANRYLLDENGDSLTGWHTIDGGRYYFREDGAMHTGWLEQDGRQHYFDSNGLLCTGLLEQEDKRYYLDENGSPVSGWQQFSEGYCYITESGTIPSGWLSADGHTYYLDEQGFRQYGWLEESNGRYYLDEQGVLVTDWLTLDGNTYYMGTDGVMTVGWADIEGDTYYFSESGSRHSGWLEESGKRYYFSEEGILHTGWLEEGGIRYYLLEDGTPAVGKLEIDGQNYFFSSTGMNFILVNPWNPLPEDFEAQLVQVPGAWVDPVCQEELEQMLADCRAAGFYPQIVSSYRSVADQQVNLQNMIDSYLEAGSSYGEAYRISTQIVALPGTSEHHLGLALDIVDAGYPKLNHDQAHMPTQKWLMENAWKYGFIMRYPAGSTQITGIIYEPWHYRYVGKELAAELHELGDIPLEVYIDNLTADGSTCGGKQSNE